MIGCIKGSFMIGMLRKNENLGFLIGIKMDRRTLRRVLTDKSQSFLEKRVNYKQMNL